MPETVTYREPFATRDEAESWLEREEHDFPAARLRIERKGTTYYVMGSRPAEDADAPLQ